MVNVREKVRAQPIDSSCWGLSRGLTSSALPTWMLSARHQFFTVLLLVSRLRFSHTTLSTSISRSPLKAYSEPFCSQSSQSCILL